MADLTTTTDVELPNKPHVWPKWLRFASVAVLVATLGEVTVSERVPKSTADLCTLFKQKPHWYRAAKSAAKQWDGNIHVPMAIIFHESGFRAQARTPIRYQWGWLPVGRVSSAFGYAQAIDSTWVRFERATHAPRWRNQFDDAIEFVQWYMQQTKRINQVPKHDAYRHYLNYHEGQHGYNLLRWQKKTWLKRVARLVQQRADRYSTQMKQCNI